jgi:hypothetical protein
VYESYKRFADGRKGIIYAINKLHASKIAELYCSHGINAVAIDCDTPKDERQMMIEQFKAGEITVLVNVEIFTEGFDCPDVSFIQLARPTKSLALYLQQVGRGLRMVAGKEKTIIIDNVGLYNYFGLPDANRKWQYHFKGHDDVEHTTGSRGEGFTWGEGNYEFDESKLAEDDEEMMVVRGASNDISIQTTEQQHVPSPPPVEEFSLCGYYLLRGNSESFKVYPFVKRRGKNTGAVAGCAYEYDEGKHPIKFGNKVNENMKLVDSDPKLQTIIAFSAMLQSLSVKDLLDLHKLCHLAKLDYQDEVGLFDFLKMISCIAAQTNG